jgi:DNA repair protein RadC
MPARGLIRELPEDERPRERLLSQGSEALSDAELLAVLLRTGTRGKSAVQLATELLVEAEGLTGLLGTTYHEVRRPGLGKAKAATLLAGIELGRRLARAKLPDREPLARPRDVVEYLSLRYPLRGQEILGALFLDGRRRLMGERELYRGTFHETVVEPREVLRECLLRSAAGVVLFHTHPSGDPTPSAQDLHFTRRMVEATRVVGVELVDHLILVGGGDWVSMKERGAW